MIHLLAQLLPSHISPKARKLDSKFKILKCGPFHEKSGGQNSCLSHKVRKKYQRYKHTPLIFDIFAFQKQSFIIQISEIILFFFCKNVEKNILKPSKFNTKQKLHAKPECVLSLLFIEFEKCLLCLKVKKNTPTFKYLKLFSIIFRSFRFLFKLILVKYLAKFKGIHLQCEHICFVFALLLLVLSSNLLAVLCQGQAKHFFVQQRE